MQIQINFDFSSKIENIKDLSFFLGSHSFKTWLQIFKEKVHFRMNILQNIFVQMNMILRFLGPLTEHLMYGSWSVSLIKISPFISLSVCFCRS